MTGFDYTRPRQILEHIGKLYPQAWRQIDDLRRMRGNELRRWDDWCFCPLAGAYAVVSGGGTERVPMQKGDHVGIVGALAAWRVTQGIYEFDRTVFDSLINTPLDGKIPVEVLFRLPEWCCYIVTPSTRLGSDKHLHGFFVHLEQDANDGRVELRFVLDTTDEAGDELIPQPLHLKATLDESIRATVAEVRKQTSARGVELPQPDGEVLRSMAEDTGKLLAVTLYLCTQAAEMRDAAGTGRQPAMPQPTKTRHGVKLFPPDRPTRWEVAYRLGAALRLAMRADVESFERSDTGRARPRVHVRRQHWHAFWTGKRDDEAQRKIVLRWLPPIPVNLDTVDELIPTVRGVQ